MNFIHLVFRLTSQAPELVNVLLVNEQKDSKGVPSREPAAATLPELLYICLILGIVSTLPQGRRNNDSTPLLHNLWEASAKRSRFPTA